MNYKFEIVNSLKNKRGVFTTRNSVINRGIIILNVFYFLIYIGI